MSDSLQDPRSDSQRSGSSLAPMVAVALVAALLCAAGCASPPVPAEGVASTAQVWPPAPARARVRWVAEIRVPADLGIRPGLLRRLWNRIAGTEPPRLVRPHGVAVDARGRLWVTDPGASRVHVFDSEGNRYLALPRGERSGLVSPVAVVFDGEGVAYISDSARGVIERFDPRGRFLGSWDAQGGLVRPTGLAYDRERGLLWVADTGEHRLVALDRDGRVRRSLGTRGRAPGRFNFPTHLSLDAAGRVYVTDTLNFRVQVLSPQGEPLAEIGRLGDGPGAFSKPKGVALDRDGHVYVVDSLFDNVQVFDRQGHVLLHFGDHGSAPGQFWLPTGLCVADGNRIYVADSYNQRIQVFEYLGD